MHREGLDREMVLAALASFETREELKEWKCVELASSILCDPSYSPEGHKNALTLLMAARTSDLVFSPSLVVSVVKLLDEEDHKVVNKCCC